MIWLDQIVQGVFLGSYYALIACGLSFLYGVMRVINLAHGSLAVVAAYLVYWLTAQANVPLVGAFAIVVPIMAGLGWLLQRFVLERSLRSGPLVPLLSTFGLAIIVDNLLFERFGADTQTLSTSIGDLAFGSWVAPGGITIAQLSVITLAAAMTLLGGLQLFLDRSPLGRAIRATADDPETAELVGIDARNVYGAAAAIALATVAIAGIFLGLRASFEPYAGATQLIFAFEAVVIGGAGSLWGTLIGGIVLGVAQNIGAQINPQGFLIAGHVVFFAVLGARVLLGGRSPLPALARLRRQRA